MGRKDKMKVLEALAHEISRQKKINALMKMKAQKELELKEIRAALRLTIYRK
jgi:cell shape-determining protein MreC